jgi:antitoxin PrlF
MSYQPTRRRNTQRYYVRYADCMRVTSKGQVTIPRDVRRRLGVEPGSEVDFVVDADAVRLIRRDTGDGRALVTQMRGRRRLAMSTDEIMALTRSER